MTWSFAPASLQGFSLLRSLRPWWRFGILSPLLTLVPFPLHRHRRFPQFNARAQTGSRHLYAGHHLASKQVSARLIWGNITPQFRCHLCTFDTWTVVHVVRLLWFTPDTFSDAFSVTLTTGAFDQPLTVVCNLRLHADCGGLPHLSRRLLRHTDVGCHTWFALTISRPLRR